MNINSKYYKILLKNYNVLSNHFKGTFDVLMLDSFYVTVHNSFSNLSHWCFKKVNAFKSGLSDISGISRAILTFQRRSIQELSFWCPPLVGSRIPHQCVSQGKGRHLGRRKRIMGLSRLFHEIELWPLQRAWQETH